MGSPGPSTREQIRARDGDACWLCRGTLSFAADAKEGKKPTIEHLQPRSLGGGNALDNLRLCHPGCNKQLGNRPRAEKERMREKRELACARNAAKLAKAAPPQAKPTAAGKGKAAAATPAPAAKVAPTKPATPATVRLVAATTAPRRSVPATDLHRHAMIATAAATFFAGLSLGMLVG